MKGVFLTFIVLLLHLLACAQSCPLTHTFQVTFGNSGDDEILDIKPTKDGGTICAGKSNSFGEYEGWLVKTDKFGNIIWSKIIGGPLYDYFRYIESTSDGGYIATGATSSFGNIAGDAWAVKFDSAGNVQWSKSLGINNTILSGACQLSNGSIAIIGYVYTSGSSARIYVVNIDSNNGNIIWGKSYFQSSTDYAYVIHQAKDGNLLVAGFTGSFGAGSTDAYLMKINNNDGNLIWLKTYGSGADDVTDYLTEDANDNIYFCGQWNSSAAFVMKADDNGNLIWSKEYNGDNTRLRAGNIKITKDNNLIIGTLDNNNLSGRVIKLDTSGNVIWTHQYYANASSQNSQIKAFPLPNDYGFIIGGSSDASGNYDGYLIKTDSAGGTNNCNNISLTTNSSDIFPVVQDHNWTIQDINILQAINPIVQPANITSNFFCKTLCCKDTTITIDTAICNSSSYQLPNGSFTSTAGTYIDTLLSSGGCDSIITTNLITNACPEKIINNYASVFSYNNCSNALAVDSATDFHPGDSVLIIQMKGAVIDSSNSNQFGTITDYKNAGNYELTAIKAISGNNIILKYKLLRDYDFVNGKVQIVSIPVYNNLTVDTVLTCRPWDGNKGGVLIFSAKTLTLNSDINVSEKGFAGGVHQDILDFSGNYACGSEDYFYPYVSKSGDRKGEGIITLSDNYKNGRGAAANGGGGGNATNAGGGGGSNGAAGGNGGYEYGFGCGSGYSTNTGGIGGNALTYSNANNKIFMGGGGGAGEENENGSPNGGNGGGIVFILSDQINGNNHFIFANGQSPTGFPNGYGNDGGSGGGAGGSILMNITNITNQLSVQALGGNGSNAVPKNPTSKDHGPGGGGAGGVMWINQNVQPANLTYYNQGGKAGVFTANNENWGATDGKDGIALTDLVLPSATITTNNDSLTANFTFAETDCQTFTFKDSSYTKSVSDVINHWQWAFGDSSVIDTISNTVHYYDTSGNYNVQLLVSTIGGCVDSITKPITVRPEKFNIHLGNDTTICQGTSILLNAVSPNATYLWQDNSTDSVYTVNNAGTYYVHVANIYSCSSDDTIQINISVPPIINLGNDTTFCQGDTLILDAASPNANYLWQDNSTDSVYAATLAGKYKVIVTNPFLCASQDSVNIAINPSPAVNLGNDTTICQGTSILLNAFNNNSTYQWQDGSINPGYLVNQAGNYSVIVTNNFACVDSDEIKVDTSENPVLELGNDTTICSNDTLLLNAAWPNSTYLWQDGSQDAVFAATLAGNYSVLVTNNFYCSATDQINIAINPAPIIDLGNDTTLCNGNTFLLDASSPGAANYLWQDGSALSFYNVMQSGAYWVTVTNINNCFASDSINIIATDIPNLQLSLDTISICPGQQIPLAAIATNADSYLWEDGSTDSARIITNPGQWYYVTATNGCGSVTDSLYATLSICYLYVPTAFSPNMDGHNDFFQPKFTDIISKYHLTIFSRWGEKVFSSTDPLNGWDGKYKNANCDTGAYVWMMRYIDRTGKPVFLHGALTLIR